MGKIISVVAQKGGVGKSTITFNIAASLAQQGRDVMVVDADNQSSVSAWHAIRSNDRPDLPKVHCSQKEGWIHHTLLDFIDRYDYVLVDTAGRESLEMRSAMAVSDVLISPIKASQFDLITLETMSALIRSCLKANKKLIAYCLINLAPTNKKITEIDSARKTISEYPEFILLETVMHDRKVYRDSMIEGCGVCEMGGKSDSEQAAKQEITALVKEVLRGI